MKVIGLTGSIATGKSTVSDYIKSLGYTVIDADQIAKESAYNDLIQKQVQEQLGKNILTERQALGEMIVQDKQKQKILESIIHPYVYQEIRKKIKQHAQELIFIDVPLLFETNPGDLYDFIVVVYTNEATQLERLINRNHISKEQAMQWIQSQMSIEQKKERADYVIDNQGTIEATYKQVDAFINQIKE